MAEIVGLGKITFGRNAYQCTSLCVCFFVFWKIKISLSFCMISQYINVILITWEGHKVWGYL